MVRYSLAGDGKTWVPEYGSPDDPALLKALLAYSPYHQLKPGTAYPAVLRLGSPTGARPGFGVRRLGSARAWRPTLLPLLLEMAAKRRKNEPFRRLILPRRAPGRPCGTSLGKPENRSLRPASRDPPNPCLRAESPVSQSKS